jgi:hypothetical protein
MGGLSGLARAYDRAFAAFPDLDVFILLYLAGSAAEPINAVGKGRFLVANKV